MFCLPVLRPPPSFYTELPLALQGPAQSPPPEGSCCSSSPWPLPHRPGQPPRLNALYHLFLINFYFTGCVCMCACICVCMHVCVYVHTYVCVRACMDVWVCVYVHMCIFMLCPFLQRTSSRTAVLTSVTLVPNQLCLRHIENIICWMKNKCCIIFSWL